MPAPAPAFTTPDVLFADLFRQPLHRPLKWKKRKARRGEVSLAGGVWLEAPPPFADPGVATALEDFREFLRCQSIATPLKEGAGGLPLRFRKLKGKASATASAIGRFRVEVKPDGIVLSTDNADGIRRGLVWMEEEMEGREGAFLPQGRHEWKEVISTRISRCFYGPIQRPPFNRNELADDVNYYPEGYLNRLAHDGVTALWITVKFRESVPSAIFPEYGRHAAQHLAKLRATVERCAKYGIRVYVFCIEPAALSINSPLLAEHPSLRGAQVDDLVTFCAQSEIGRAYLEEATATLFEAVPGLGGMIVIPVGERLTHCASHLPETFEACPRCAPLGKNRVLHDVLEAFRKGMDRVAPDAELIAWPYGQMICWGGEAMVESAAHIPKGVVLQHNYETGGVAMQLGKPRPLWDYWLSWTGVSPVFEGAARQVRARGGRISAKLQVGNSHEDATVPFFPVPGLLYRKYRAMHRMGVSAAMQSWYFGNYPSLMTRAAGRLSFAPLPESEEAFLKQLAGKEWGAQAGKVARAWLAFGQGYENFPATHVFSYYGPVQNGVTWPLYLKPRREPLSPSWKLDFPPSGDYIPHCLSHRFTLEEVHTLCARIVREWQRGCRLLGQAYASSARTPAQRHEWQIAEAIRLQFENALAILRFYLLREKLVEARTAPARERLLDRMAALVREEIARRKEFLPLLRREPILGYHSEAEGFKVTPEGVEAAIAQLRDLLKGEFAEVRRDLHAPTREWFGDYTGRNIAKVPHLVLPQNNESTPSHPLRYWLFSDSKRSVLRERGTSRRPSRLLPVTAAFRLTDAGTALHFTVELTHTPEVPAAAPLQSWKPSVVIDIEPSRMRPRVEYTLTADGTPKGYYEEGYLQPNPEFEAHWETREHHRTATLSIPTATLDLSGPRKPFRFNVRLLFFHPGTGEIRELSWICRTPMQPRLIWADVHPATDYGWAIPDSSER